MTTITHNRHRKNSPWLTVILAVCILFLVVGSFWWRNGLASVLWRVGEPVINTSTAAGSFLGTLFSPFFSKAGLVAENNRLQAALASSSMELIDRNVLYKENLRLHALLGRTSSSSDTVFAGVLLRPPGIPYDTLIIDAGKNDGVRLGNLVSSGGIVVVGTIDAVYDTTSRVKLFSAPGEEYEGYIAGTIPVIVKGQGGGSMVAEVPVGEQVTVGSEVLFPGVASRFSARVSWVETKEGSSFTTIYMALPVTIFSMRFVQVLTKTILYEQE